MALSGEALYRRIKSGAIKVNRRSPAEHRFWAKVDRGGPIHPVLKTRCWVWTANKDKHGYGQFKTGDRPHAAHRWSWQTHRGPVPLGLCVLHHCDNPACVNPAHLFLGTHSDNATDREAKGRGGVKLMRRGEQNGWAKLTEEMVREARRRHVKRDRQNGCHAIAREFGVSPNTVYYAVTGHNWRHV